MTKAEMVSYIVENISNFAEYSDAEIQYVVSKWRKEADAEVVEETMLHIRGGYYTAEDPEGFADSAEDPEDVFANQICKNCYAVKRERKIADNREHQRRLKLKRGVIVDE